MEINDIPNDCAFFEDDFMSAADSVANEITFISDNLIFETGIGDTEDERGALAHCGAAPHTPYPAT